MLEWWEYLVYRVPSSSEHGIFKYQQYRVRSTWLPSHPRPQHNENNDAEFLTTHNTTTIKYFIRFTWQTLILSQEWGESLRPSPQYSCRSDDKTSQRKWDWQQCSWSCQQRKYVFLTDNFLPGPGRWWQPLTSPPPPSLAAVWWWYLYTGKTVTALLEIQGKILGTFHNRIGSSTPGGKIPFSDWGCSSARWVAGYHWHCVRRAQGEGSSS